MDKGGNMLNEDLKVFGAGMVDNRALHQLNALVLKVADLEQENRELRKTIHRMEMIQEVADEKRTRDSG